MSERVEHTDLLTFSKALFQAQDVVRRQHDVDVLAAGIEAIDVLVAAELDNRVLTQLVRQHRAYRGRGVFNQLLFIRHNAYLSLKRGQHPFFIHQHPDPGSIKRVLTPF